MDKEEIRKIRERVAANLAKIKVAGWVSISCDNYDRSHFLKGERVYEKDGRKLCRDCVLKEVGS